MKSLRWTSGNSRTLALMAINTVMLAQTFYLSRVAARVPQFIILGTLLLLGIQLMLDLGHTMQAGRVSGSEHRNEPRQKHTENGQARFDIRFFLAIFWIALLGCLSWFLGIVVGPALFCLFFLRWSAGESWLMSLSYAVFMALLINSVFSLFLNLSPYPGVLTRLLS